MENAKGKNRTIATSAALLVCPVYNEFRTLDRFIEGVNACFDGDLVFVNDGSTDGSLRLLRAASGGRFSIIHHPCRRGYGASLASGFDFALRKGYERVVTIDADLQHNPAHIIRFLSELERYDLVLGSRYLKGVISGDRPPIERYMINRIISDCIAERCGVRFSDPFCGFRGYRKEFLMNVRFGDTSYGAALEIVLDAVRLGAKRTEIVVDRIYRDDTRGFLDGLDDPDVRLEYYRTVIRRKCGEMLDEETVSFCKSAPR
jgi:dolichol-phosphate mannosyltransferase